MSEILSVKRTTKTVEIVTFSVKTMLLNSKMMTQTVNMVTLTVKMIIKQQ